MVNALKTQTLNVYSPLEERLNIYSHAFACVASIIGLFLLLNKAWQLGSVLHAISFSIYCFSMVTLYASSSVYHASQTTERRLKLKVFDHAAIYIFIAGSYTPFTLITLQGSVGWWMFAITWSMAAIGVVLKCFYTGRFKLISTAMYVFMGWIIIFAIEPLQAALATAGLNLLIAGGIAYTLGAIVYSIKIIPLNHAIFHVLVVAGSVLQFFAVFYYV